MKRLSTLMAVAMAILASAGCDKNNVETPADNPVKPDPQEQAMVFSATTDIQTKTALSPDEDVYNVIWQEGDQIRINGYVCDMVTDQPDGFGPGQTKAIFSGFVLNTTTYEAWYPVSMSTAWYYKKSLPATQTYIPDNVKEFPMYATGETTDLQFKNLCGIIRLNLKGAKSVSSIGLVDKSESPKGLSGEYQVADFCAVPDGIDGVLLNCETPVELNAESFTPFLIAVPAGSYDKLQITVSATDGTAAVLTSNKTISVQRSMITTLNISSPKFKAPGDDIIYTTKGTTMLGKYATGADASVFGEGLTVMSHSYDASTKTGVISLSGTATQVGQSAFASTDLVTITLPNNIETFGRESFYNSRNLTTVSKPSKLKTIDYRAFCNAMAFTGIDLSGITSIGADAFSGSAFTGEVVIGSGLAEIGQYAFRNCKGLTVIFNAMPATMGNCIFEGSGVTSATFNCDAGNLPGYMFNQCKSLTAVVFKGTLGSIGNNDFYGCSALTDISLDGTGVTTIGSEAFRGAALSASFSIPSTVTSIGGSAFCACSGLVSITVPDAAFTGNNTFQECINLESVTFTEGTRTTAIPYRTFYGCTKLTSVNIPTSVTNIGQEAFDNCGLTSLPSGWDRSGITYGNNPFAGCPITSITFPDSWTSIPNYFCCNMKQLASVDFGHTVSTIGSHSFDSCTALTAVNIPSNVTKLVSHCFYRSGVTSVTGMNRTDLTVENNAFAESKLQSADISNWTVVPGGCFNSCKDLSSVTLGEGLKTISANAFEKCSSLTAISLPSTLEKMENYCFKESGLTALPSGMHDMTFGNNIFQATPMTSVTFPAGMTTTGNYMFSGCTSISSADLADVTNLAEGTFVGCSTLTSVNFRSVENLQRYAFNNCKALTEVTLPDSLVRMYEHAFDGCTGLKKVDIGTGITKIDGWCFQNDNNLETLIIRAAAVPTLSNSLNSVSNAHIPSIHVPSSLIGSYQAAAVWSNYSEFFLAIE